MQNSDKSIFEYDIPPYVQVGAVLLAILLFVLVSEAFGAMGIADIDGGTPWLIAVSLTFFFTIGNSVMSLASEDQNNYWWQSLVGYGVLAFVGGGIAYLFSGASMDVYGSYKWLYVMFAMGHVFFLVLVRTMRKIVKVAKEQDKALRGED